MNSKNSASAVIVAAGRSKRMGRLGDKIWIKVAGRPVLFYSLRAFIRAGVRDIVVVVRPGTEHIATRRIAAFRFPSRVRIQAVAGGAERQDSVWNGLTVSAAPIVLVHDAARPAIRPELIKKIWRAAVSHGACVPAVPVNDTIKRVRNSRVIQTVERSELFAVQTPQGFQKDVLLSAISAARRAHCVGTDCASLVERTGRKVAIAPGDPLNLKLTRPQDLTLLKPILANVTMLKNDPFF